MMTNPTPTTKRQAVVAMAVAIAAAGLMATSPARPEGSSDPTGMEGECIGCHEDDVSGKNVHSPVEDEECEMCHEAGEGDHQFSLPDPIAEVCTACHDDPAEVNGHVHGPVASGNCTRCHDPHASEHGSLLIADLPDLCWRCHRRPIPREGSDREVANVHREVTASEVLHEAVDSGCDTCHPSHASDRPGLFTGAFPAGPYAQDYENAYELCIDCHDSDPIFLVETDETGFREGKKNLHAIHVAREKSRSCALCHSPHGGGPHLLRSSVPFGSWRLPIGFKALENGGKCETACHETREYSIIPRPLNAKEQREPRQP